jgi:hypothetical protein
MNQPGALEVAALAARAFEKLNLAYAVVGSVASGIHGEPRATLDVDITLRLRTRDVKALCAELAQDFHVDPRALEDSVRTGFPCNLIHRRAHVKLDVYVKPDAGIQAQEWRRAQRVRLTGEAGSEANVASAEDTVLQKLVWYRKGDEVSDRQWRDVLGVLKTRGPALERDYLREWGATLGVLDLLQRGLVEAGQPPLAL